MPDGGALSPEEAAEVATRCAALGLGAFVVGRGGHRRAAVIVFWSAREQQRVDNPAGLAAFRKRAKALAERRERGAGEPMAWEDDERAYAQARAEFEAEHGNADGGFWAVRAGQLDKAAERRCYVCGQAWHGLFSVNLCRGCGRWVCREHSDDVPGEGDWWCDACRRERGAGEGGRDAEVRGAD